MSEAAKPAAGGGENANNEEVKKPGVAGGESKENESSSSEAPLDPGAALKKPEGEAAKPGAGEQKSEAQLQAEAATGLDLTPFSDEFIEKGALSEESYAKLATKGISKETADTYIAGVRAQADARNVALSSLVGGVDNFNAVIKWGAGALSEAEKAEAVKFLSGKDESAAKTFFMGLNARFEKEVGRDPGKRSGGGGSAAEDVFKNRAEQAAAMRDPRYQNDRAYRSGVMEKSIRSFSDKSAKKRTRKAAPKTTRRARSKGARK